MAYLTESEVVTRASRLTDRVQKSASRVLTELRASADDQFDIFLSHSSSEPETILLGIKALLEDAGLKVYVDKYSDPQLSPDNVTPQTAEILRGRMGQSKALLYVYSQHSKKSRWMPWELGFFDGAKGRVGVVPVTKRQEEAFKGEEYLNLYPYVDKAAATTGEASILWINQSRDHYAQLKLWARGLQIIEKRGS